MSQKHSLLRPYWADGINIQWGPGANSYKSTRCKALNNKKKDQLSSRVHTGTRSKFHPVKLAKFVGGDHQGLAPKDYVDPKNVLTSAAGFCKDTFCGTINAKTKCFMRMVKDLINDWVTSVLWMWTYLPPKVTWDSLMSWNMKRNQRICEIADTRTGMDQGNQNQFYKNSQ
ncbi:hypothetical protein BC832DRAFT_540885 [Gaertneriomyces semiglobifer]|nr:hypothetical protein BC832DRAFT_540885 [Gaertneriomyces semiglobifer]